MIRRDDASAANRFTERTVVSFGLAGMLLLLWIGAALFDPFLLAQTPPSERTPTLAQVKGTTDGNASATSSSVIDVTFGTPTRLMIPRIGVDAPVVPVGLEQDGSMQEPQDWDTVGWFGLGPKPGEAGSSVLAGHLDSDTGPAVFWQIDQLQPNDTIQVTDVRGEVHTFRVIDTQTIDAAKAPMDELFRKDGSPVLTLITCRGQWDGQEYDERLVVRAAPVDGTTSANANPGT